MNQDFVVSMIANPPNDESERFVSSPVEQNSEDPGLAETLDYIDHLAVLESRGCDAIE
jgi:hypothetical protein